MGVRLQLIPDWTARRVHPSRTLGFEGAWLFQPCSPDHNPCVDHLNTSKTPQRTPHPCEDTHPPASNGCPTISNRFRSKTWYLSRFSPIPLPSRPRWQANPMTQPRSQLVSPTRTRFYHCVSRCVRRAWLFGEDTYTKKNFDHRKPWLLGRMKLLEEVFAIRVAAYAVMSNHYHVVLYVDLEQSQSWGRKDVARRWLRIFHGDPLAHAYLRGSLKTKKNLSGWTPSCQPGGKGFAI